MSLALAELIFNDTASKFNKDLTEFLKRNITTVISKGLVRFKFTIAGPADLNKLRKRGVKRLPTMILDNKHYTGVPLIIEELSKRVKKCKTAAPPITEEEVLANYYTKELDIKKDSEGKFIPLSEDDEEPEDFTKLISTSLDKEANRRGLKEKKPQPAKPSRDVDNDDDTDNRRAPSIQTNRPGQRPTMRHDNIDLGENDPGDPARALAKISRTGGGGDAAKDNQMMEQLLAKMSPDIY